MSKLMNELTYKGTTFKVGDRVQISDGNPMPPARFNKKMDAWESRNKTGTIVELMDYPEPHGGISMSDDKYPPSIVITYQFSFSLGGSVTVTKIPKGWEEAA